MIRHRAGTAARVHVVATHGGPGERYAHIDETGLRERFGDVIVRFHHIDSKTGSGVPELTAAIAATAAGLPHVSRLYPASWLRLRDSLNARAEPFLPYHQYVELAADEGLSPVSARSLALNAHALGHWVHYADDPSLSELVILKPDWLSVAIGYVLEDPPTIQADGLLHHRRLPDIWDSPRRDPAHRYLHHVQQLFLRLMEQFELTYRVPAPVKGEPLSLVAQLVPAARPDLAELWDRYRPDGAELTQVCRIVETGTAWVTIPEALMYRLIVLFHRFALGRDDVAASTHWQTGMLLRDRYGARALVTLSADGLTVRVRGPFPEAFLHLLMTEIREYVERFWKGLTTRVMIPCRVPCGINDPGRGLFDVDKLITRRGRGKADYPCPVDDCDLDADINTLLLGLDARRTDADRLAAVLRETVGESLDTHVERLITIQQAGTRAILGRIEDLDDATKAAFSRAEERLTVLMRSLDDDAADGAPARLDHPLDAADPMVRALPPARAHPRPSPARRGRLHRRRTPGVVDQGGPIIRATSVVLKTLLPVSLAAAELDLTDTQWSAAKEQLGLTAKSLSAAAEAGESLDIDPDDGDRLAAAAGRGELPVRAEGGLLRLLRATLKEQDVTFADLRRVRTQQGRFRWVHPRFVEIYQPPLPEIPVD